MEVHFYTEYHGSREQYDGKIAKGYEDEATFKDDTYQRIGHTIHTLVSFTAETDFTEKK